MVRGIDRMFPSDLNPLFAMPLIQVVPSKGAWAVWEVFCEHGPGGCLVPNPHGPHNVMQEGMTKSDALGYARRLEDVLYGPY